MLQQQREMWLSGPALVLICVLLATSCAGISRPPSANRVVQGKISLSHEFPFMALVQYLDPIKGIVSCGGTILDREHILTAAHCVTHEGVPLKVDGKSVWIGANLKSDLKGVQLLKIMAHYDFNDTDNKLVRDIAVLKVGSLPRMRFNANAKPPYPMTNIQLASDDDLCCDIKDKQNLTIVGWGLTAEDRKRPPYILMKAHVESMPITQCMKNYEHIGGQVDYNKICVHSQDAPATCKGDSGGPLLRYEQDGTPVQVGITAGGSGGCQSKLGKIFIKVASYRRWIEQCRCGKCKHL